MHDSRLLAKNTPRSGAFQAPRIATVCLGATGMEFGMYHGSAQESKRLQVCSMTKMARCLERSKLNSNDSNIQGVEKRVSLLCHLLINPDARYVLGRGLGNFFICWLHVKTCPGEALTTSTMYSLKGFPTSTKKVIHRYFS